MKERELAIKILDLFEEYLNKKNVEIPNDERDEAIKVESDLCILFGSEYYSLESEITEMVKQFMMDKKQLKLFIPENKVVPEQGYYDQNNIVRLLRFYKNNPNVIQFIADMLEK